jgi:D-ribose pyranase
MKKTTLLNGNISAVISRMGHFDTITIADAGLPVPDGVERIDLALTLNVPTFLQAFEAVMSELCVQKMTLAEEITGRNKKLYQYLKNYCSKNKIELALTPHENFKELSKKSKAVVRTGECKAYANVILESGVTF